MNPNSILKRGKLEGKIAVARGRITSRSMRGYTDPNWNVREKELNKLECQLARAQAEPMESHLESFRREMKEIVVSARMDLKLDSDKLRLLLEIESVVRNQQVSSDEIQQIRDTIPRASKRCFCGECPSPFLFDLDFFWLLVHLKITSVVIPD